MTPTPQTSVLTYLATAHRLNNEPEVSGPELQRELRLDAGTIRECVAELAGQGLVVWDPHLSNIWLRLTDKGLMAANRVKRLPNSDASPTLCRTRRAHVGGTPRTPADPTAEGSQQ